MERRLVTSIACISVLSAFAACSSGKDDVHTTEGNATQAQLDDVFDVDDVSILFPIVSQGATTRAFPDIQLDDALWKQSHFTQVMDQATKLGIAEVSPGILTQRDLYRPVALRFDPCAPGLSQAARDANPGPAKGLCLIQVRLIVQPINSAAGTLGDVDVSTHLVFTIGASPRDQLKNNPLVRQASQLLADIKSASKKAGAETAGQPLGPHPGLVAKDAAVESAVRAFVTTMTAKPISRGVAFMGLKGTPEPWTFMAGTVDPKDDTWKIAAVPRLGGALSQDLDFINPGRGPVVPREDGDQTKQTVIAAGRSTTPLLEGLASGPDGLLNGAAFDVENAKSTHFFNASCVSCHTASGQVFARGIGGFMTAGASDPVGAKELAFRMPVPKGITGYVLKANGQTNKYNARNFGYFKSKATVSGRTVAESAEVVDFMNTEVNPAPEVVANAASPVLHGPGRDCSSNDAEVFLCVRDAKPGVDCFAKCVAPPFPEPAVVVPPPAPPVPQPVVPTDACAQNNPSAKSGTVGVTTDASSSIATVGGNDQSCLSTILRGKFDNGAGVTVACVKPNECTVSIPRGSVTASLSPADSGSFATSFQVAGKTFRSRGTGAGAVQISCTAASAPSCSISVADSPSSLPAAPSALFNP